VPPPSPEIANLLRLLAQSTGKSIEDLAIQYASAKHAAFKEDLIQALSSTVIPISQEIQRLRQDPGFVHGVLADGAERARAMAAETLKEVRREMGLL
jgi:tryptophanyl-tRNA synthetase